MKLPHINNTSWPSAAQWKQFYRVLSGHEKIALPILVAVFLFSAVSLGQNIYFSNANIVPTHGGNFTEGMVGSPRFLNPLYADANDVDRNLIWLVYSGMLTYDTQGKLIPDLATQLPEISADGKTLTIILKENVQWHDGTPFTADDVIFTINALKDPASRSPIRANWIGVDIEKVSDHIVRFHLIDPYAPFPERLTVKILPAHIWGEISPENYSLTALNLQPIGTGPYHIKDVRQNRSGFVQEIQLQSYQQYHLGEPFISSLSFRFFETENDVIAAANRGTVDSFSLENVSHIQSMKNPAFQPYAFPLPRYFALFFNLDAPTNQQETEDLPIRKALQLALNTQTLVQEVFGANARTTHSPFLPDIFGIAKPDPALFTPDQTQALQILQQEGYTKENGIIHKVQVSGNALTQDLQRNDSGADVRALQQCLANSPGGGPDVYPEGIVNGNFGQLTFQAVVRFQEKHAKEVLTPLGLSKGTGKAGELTRAKLNELCFPDAAELMPLTVRIVTLDQPPLLTVAKEIEKQWEAFGVQVDIHSFPAPELERDIIKPRTYQTLLFGEVLRTIPDPFPFWHSSQSQTPGLNVSQYENKRIDALLEELRKEADPALRNALLEEMQDILLADIPAIMIYSFDHHYYTHKKIQGIHTSTVQDPSQRFATIAQWFIETKRSRN